MKLPNAEHECRPWRIHELVPDFTLEDVWALPDAGRRRGLPGPARAWPAPSTRPTRIPPDSLPLEPPRPPRQLVRPRRDLGPGRRRGAGRAADSRHDRDLTARPAASRPARHGGGLGFRLAALRPPLPHRPRGRRRGLEQDRARRRCTWPGSTRARAATRAGWPSTSSHAARFGRAYMALIKPFRLLDRVSSADAADRADVGCAHERRGVGDVEEGSALGQIGARTP